MERSGSLKSSGFFAVKIFSILMIFVIAFSSCAREPASPFKILPKPRKVKFINSAGVGFRGLKKIRIEGDFRRPVMGPILSLLPLTDQSERGTLTLKLSAARKLPESEEGYILLVKNGQIEIESRGEAGLFYGCQTLEQLLEDSRDSGMAVLACTMTDYPALSYRAVHIDVKHHLDTMKYYYDSIDRLARYKINAVIFEFEDKLRYRRRPLVGAPQAISIDEMAALTRYARKRHIEISPLVQGLGHATFILKHEEYAPLREDPESRWAFCPCDEGTYELLFDLYRDAFEATPGSRYLHVGGDEVGEIGQCPRCKQRAESEGKLGLNLYWLNRVCDFAQKQGRIPIFWDDMIFKYAGVWETMGNDLDRKEVSQLWKKGEPVLDSVLDQYPKNCVYMRWNYTPARQEGNIRALEWFQKRGLKAWIATAAQNVHPLLPQDDRVNIIQSFIQLADEKKIDGMLCTAWDDSSPHMETYWRGLIASAEFSWNPEGRKLEEYEKVFLQREFGPACVEATELYADLFQAVSFWNSALCEKGNHLRMEKLLELPDLKNPGAWSRKSEDRLKTAEGEVKRHEELKAQLITLRNRAHRNRYHLELLSAINDFQVTSAHLLLTLKECDTASKRKRAEGMRKVWQSLEGFEQAWRKLKEVYEETRFLSYPEDYVQDRYFHLASRKEDLTWMIEVETQFHELVKDWLADNEKRD
ncbi:MAG: beta-N-acetylhexosaminidase [Candidatus Aminicenantes bacterium]|nr:beta-N-acetylhexosaminidase [Candidatus Aminicenantes bacterium]